jgi:hypothetical protein
VISWVSLKISSRGSGEIHAVTPVSLSTWR